jgi:hypothetical protein
MISDVLSDAAAMVRDYLAQMPEVYAPVLAEVNDVLERMDALRAKLDAPPVPDPRTALEELEAACEALAATRSGETYLAMIDKDKATDALLRLDRARSNARAILGKPVLPEALTRRGWKETWLVDGSYCLTRPGTESDALTLHRVGAGDEEAPADGFVSASTVEEAQRIDRETFHD